MCYYVTRENITLNNPGCAKLREQLFKMPLCWKTGHFDTQTTQGHQVSGSSSKCVSDIKLLLMHKRKICAPQKHVYTFFLN